MSHTKTLLMLLIISGVALPSCKSLTECKNIQRKEAFFLLDVSDKKLFENIEDDLDKNFPGFMQRTSMGNITPCQSFKLSFAHLSAKESLDINSAEISIDRKGLSKNEERKLANPAPLVQLMQKKINEYRLFSENPVMTAGSNIANVLLKVIIQSNPNADNYIFVFSDMVENNRQINLYKKIPYERDIKDVINKIIEPDVLRKFRQLQQGGLEDKIIVVLKSDPTGKTNQRDIKNFWSEVFKELKVDAQFIDNLSNNVGL